MRPIRPIILLAWLLSAGLAQEPSTKDLRTLLHADVKSYANDGRLIATWRLVNADQLLAFELSGEESVKLVAGEGIQMTAAPDKPSVLAFKELQFRQPFKISFDLKLEDPQAALGLNVWDPDAPEDRFHVGLNFRVYSNTTDRFEFIGRMKGGAADGQPSATATAIAPRAWTPVTLELTKDRLVLSHGRKERCSRGNVAFKRFAIVLHVAEGKAMVRNLAVDSQVDRDSIRKLFRSVKATTASRPAGEDVADLQSSAWAQLANEMEEGDWDAAAVAELESLAPAVQKEVEDAMSSMGKDAASTRQARQKIDHAIQLAPKVAVLHWLRGVIAEHEEEGDRAIACFEKAVEVNPKLLACWLSLGAARAERGRTTPALDAFAKAESLDPAYPWVHVARARVMLQQGQLANGRKEIDRALAKKPDSAGLKAFAKCLEKLGSGPSWKTPFKKETGLYVVETSISGKVAADLAEKLMKYRRFLEQAFPLQIKQTAPSRVWVFDSEAEYHAFAGSITSGHDQTIGLYHPLIKTLLLTSKVGGDATQHIIFHEAFHQYLDLAVSEPPSWLNEGLAEYYGATTFDVSNRATEGGIVQVRLPTLRKQELVPLKTLIELTHDQFMNPKTVGLHYAQSWAFVHFCKRGGKEGYTKMFDVYCAAIVAGRPASDAYGMAFGRDGEAEIPAIEREFKTYVKEKLLAK